ncbi:MAG TPA: polysaccharide deacetylase family protein [Solirubrobacterales bacterium]|jgi:peptidoglycan/xylan/chitin deacetylase (PgdA/CDA1 family)
MRALAALIAVAVIVTSLWTADPARTAGQWRVLVGCSSRAGAVARAGSPAGDRVALSFDDGPSLSQTPAILSTLERLHARATFFEEGRHAGGREELMEEILAAGDEIGNHSYHHPEYPGNGELAATDRKIREATGFEPCLFRPPYGLIDGRVEAAARRNHLEMVLWTLDSEDDHHPGAAAIRANVLAGATPGAIILMHDGGHHPQTVRALPGVIRGLRARGFRFATVTELLGGRMRYVPAAGRPGSSIHSA